MFKSVENILVFKSLCNYQHLWKTFRKEIKVLEIISQIEKENKVSKKNYYLIILTNMKQLKLVTTLMFGKHSMILKILKIGHQERNQKSEIRQTMNHVASLNS